MPTNTNPEHKEGKVATAIEEQTAKIPSDLFFMGGNGFNGSGPWITDRRCKK